MLRDNSKNKPIRKKRIKLLIIAIPFLIFIILEAILRIGFGLGNPPLSQVDQYSGYRFKPNQKITRFGHYIEYNKYSQRSELIERPKPAGNLRILMVGDSVLNGGTLIDQKETITELLENRLKEKQYSNINQIEVLNASAGSWGIGNQWGYLQKFGLLESNLLILQIGNHDLTQPTSQSDRVGKNPNYPEHKPLFALQELVTRYFLPRFFPSSTQLEIPTPRENTQEFKKNLNYLHKILILAQNKKTPVWVVFTPNLMDVIPPYPRIKNKNLFLQFLQENQVNIIDIHQKWSKKPPNLVKTYFRDSVHLNPIGNQQIADYIYAEITTQSPDFYEKN